MIPQSGRGWKMHTAAFSHTPPSGSRLPSRTSPAPQSARIKFRSQAHRARRFPSGFPCGKCKGYRRSQRRCQSDWKSESE